MQFERMQLRLVKPAGYGCVYVRHANLKEQVSGAFVMKPSVTITLGAALFAILLGAYLIAYATTPRDPVEWQDGDVIVQNVRLADTLPLFAADGSGFTHIGIVATGERGAVVIESVKGVMETPVHAFLARAKSYAIYRIGSLNEAQRKAVVAAARRQLGKPGDYFFRRSWDQLYSSELVKLAYNEIGLDLGRLQKVAKVGDLKAVRSQFSRMWPGNDDCRRRYLDFNQCWALLTQQQVITPASIVADAHLTKIYEVKAVQNTVTLTSFSSKPEAGSAQ